MYRLVDIYNALYFNRALEILTLVEISWHRHQSCLFIWAQSFFCEVRIIHSYGAKYCTYKTYIIARKLSRVRETQCAPTTMLFVQVCGFYFPHKPLPRARGPFPVC